jgi:SOS-response transcriptional repressor LexA
VDIKVNQRISEIRQKKGVNKKEFADILGIPSSIISDIENGKREPSKEFLHSLSVKYAVSLNWLYFGFGPKSLVEAVREEKHPLVINIETIVKENIGGIESRLSALEGKYDNLPGNKVAPEPEYPAESIGRGSYAQDPEPEYGTVGYFEDVAAGPPIWQQAEADKVVDVPRHLIKTKADDYYALRVRGNSMIDAHIPDGSMVLVKKSDAPQHGKIQVVWIDDRVTLKRMSEGEDHGWTLCYEDGTGRAIPLGEKNLVQGDFVAVLPPFTKPHMRGE